MKKAVRSLLLLVILLGIAWGGSMFYVGRQVEASLSDYETSLLRTGEVSVYRLEYEPGLLEGQIHYDLAWQPGPGSEWGMLVTLLQEMYGINLRTSGSVSVRPGPYIGGDTPFALALIEWEYPLPANLRAYLPQYPGDTPVLSLNSVLNFDGTLESKLTGVEYNGMLVENGETLALSLSGLTGSLDLNSQTQSARLGLGLRQFGLSPGPGEEFELENLSLNLLLENTAPDLEAVFEIGRFSFSYAEEAAEFGLNQFVLRVDSTRFRPAVWLGESNLNWDVLAIEAGGFAGAFNDFAATTSSRLDADGRYEASGETLVGSVEFGGNTIDDLRIDMSMRNIDVDGYSNLAGFGAGIEAAMGNGNSGQVFGSLLDSVNAILASQPVFSLDRLALSVIDDEDITFSYSLSYVGEAALQNMDQASDLLNDLEIDSEVHLSVPALRRLIGMWLSSVDPSMRGAALDEAVDANYQSLLTILESTGFMTITDEAIFSSMQLSEGEVTVNGMQYASTEEFMAALTSPGTGATVSRAQVEMQAEFLADPRFERVILSTGFTPDPHTVQVMAGGPGMAYEVLGVDCSGNVNSAQPDVTLSYIAGTDFGLYLYAESGTDTTLMVLSPQGWFCDDDSHGDFNPGVSIPSPETGDYMIWVGTYSEGVAKAVLRISEN